MRNLLLLLVVSLSYVGSAQTDSASKELKRQADLMADYFLKQNWSSFADFTHPRIIEMIGGKEELVKILEKGFGDGVYVTLVEMGMPGKIVKAKNELQSTITQTLELKMPQGCVKSSTTLIAFSPDEGKTWYFVDSKGDLQALKTMFPEVSDDLTVPPDSAMEKVKCKD